ncbi:hypothetical protein KM043_017994 [Ampulex compressa]|nr:hypothetical protein KM043_017994 [Ampulex compressa]
MRKPSAASKIQAGVGGGAPLAIFQGANKSGKARGVRAVHGDPALPFLLPPGPDPTPLSLLSPTVAAANATGQQCGPVRVARVRPLIPHVFSPPTPCCSYTPLPRPCAGFVPGPGLELDFRKRLRLFARALPSARHASASCACQQRTEDAGKVGKTEGGGRSFFILETAQMLRRGASDEWREVLGARR